jgi:hypothetical protein
MKKLLALIALVVAQTSYGDIITQWTFESSSPGIAGTSNHIDNIAAETGTGSASEVHASALSVWSSPAGNGSGGSLSANNWGSGDYYQFQTSTIGFSGISVQYDQTGSGTGPRDFSLSYSLDGSFFIPFGSPYAVLLNGGAPNAAWNSASGSSAYTFSYDLSGVSALDNASSVFFRVIDGSTTSISGGTVATAGTDRIDNFTVFVAPIPEPSAVALGLISGLAGLVAWKRRK